MHSVLTPAQLATLCEMLTYCRPHGSIMDRAFCSRYIAPLPGVSPDLHGNWIGDIGDSPRVLWSSHTDTVHRFSGVQTLHVDHAKQTITLSKRSRKRGNCLGADDTVGVFLMREMYLAGVPGRYIWHYGEECGCQGSGDLAQYSPESLAGVSFAIALDRAGTTDVITSQYGDTCCSEIFAKSLIDALGMDLSTARGVFTDTAQYMDLVPECTNISVGYHDQHSGRESIDYEYVGILLAALVQMDQARLICSRDPFAPKPQISRWYGSATKHANTYSASTVIDRVDGRTSSALWRNGWEDYDSCDECGYPIIDEDDPAFDEVDHCICVADEDEQDASLDENDPTLTADDRAFLRYLRGLD